LGDRIAEFLTHWKRILGKIEAIVEVIHRIGKAGGLAFGRPAPIGFTPRSRFGGRIMGAI
jgi:hypothetical protein